MQEYFHLARVSIALAGLSALAACGGGGGAGNTTPIDGGDGGGDDTTVVVSGRVTFDRLEFNSTLEDGLNGASPVESPAREVVVEAVSGGLVAATTTTDSDGNYSLNVPASSTAFIRVRAEMERTGTGPTWHFAVLNNTNSDATYVLEGDSFNTGTTASTRDLHAASGWGGSSYTGTRSAAPFAILDTIYEATALILSVSPEAEFPDLNLYWSTDNRNYVGADDLPCPDDGNIGTSFYFNGTSADGCTPAGTLPAGIYILGSYGGGAGDTDEFDQHVIAHEFGHYIEDNFSRSDSVGGEHSSGDRLDLRVAFGEGWGNAFAAMTLDDPQYRDSYNGLSTDFSFNLESDSSTNPGWFSEFSVHEILWDIFDGADTSEGDDVALGFEPIFAVMTDEQIDTEAFTSIFSFVSELKSNNSSAADAIDDLLSAENIDGNDEFGAGESHNGGDSRALPVYYDITLNSPVNNVCSSAVAGRDTFNKLGNRRFLRFENSTSRTVSISALGGGTDSGTIAAVDPDIRVFRRGELVALGDSLTSGSEVITQTLAAGTYVVEVYDWNYDDPETSNSPRCMTVSITGN